MEITLAFMFVMMVIVVGWLSHQIFSKPWATEGAIEDADGINHLPATKIGLWVFLAVVSSMFCLFASAYYTRMELIDWVPVPEPNILWANTALLILASVVMQWTRNISAGEQREKIKLGLVVTAVLSLAFVVGQLIAWQQLNTSGYLLTTNPANAFFYLLTALHAMHLLGGLWVWGRSAVKVFGGIDIAAVRLSIELCSIYWHYLLLIWLALFALLMST